MSATCQRPDRDCPKMVCGYPLPCPWHSVIVDLGATPPTVTIPVTAVTTAADSIRRVAGVAKAIRPARKKKRGR